MAVQYVDIAKLTITRPSGETKRLRDIATFNVTPTKEKTPVKAMTPDRLSPGYTKGMKSVTFEMESAIPKGGFEIDWDTICEDDEECLLQVEYSDGGVRRQLVDMVVDAVVPGFNADGAPTARITGKARDWRPDRANAIAG